MAKKRIFTASVMVSLPAGEYEAGGPKEALSKLMRTELFHLLRNSTELKEVRILVTEEGKRPVIYSVPKTPQPKKKKEVKKTTGESPRG